MSDAEAADIYRQLIALPLLVVAALAVVLTVLHVIALNGRRILPARFARVVGWLAFGLLVGLATQLTPDLLTWVVAGGIAAWILWWGWRNGRLGDAGLAFIGGAVPWLVGVGLLILVLPPDPTIPSIDSRFLIGVGALLIAAVGFFLTIVGPRTPPERKLTSVQRAMLVPQAIDRAQAMGPIAAPVVLAFIAGMSAAIGTMLGAQGLELLLREVVAGTAFIAVSLLTFWLTTPRRVTDAQGVQRWLIDAERQLWADRLGRPLPRTAGGMRQLVEELPDDPRLRPLRIEILATFGRTDEARRELARLPAETAAERAIEAELAEYLSWYEGEQSDDAMDRWARAIPSVEDPAERLRLRVSLALSRTRRAALRHDPAAIDHLLEVRPMLGSTGSRLRDPGTASVVAVIVLIGVGIYMLLPVLAELAGGGG